MFDQPIVVLAGKIGAGKSTAAVYFETHYQVFHKSFVATLWEPILRERELPVTRANLQRLGIELMRERGPKGIVNDMFATLDPANSYVIDDVRSPSVYAEVQRHAPTSRLVFVKTDLAARFPRLQQRDQIQTLDEQIAADAVATETEIDDLLPLAWRVVVNDGSEAQFALELDELALSLGLLPR